MCSRMIEDEAGILAQETEAFPERLVYSVRLLSPLSCKAKQASIRSDRIVNNGWRRLCGSAVCSLQSPASSLRYSSSELSLSPASSILTSQSSHPHILTSSHPSPLSAHPLDSSSAYILHLNSKQPRYIPSLLP